MNHQVGLIWQVPESYDFFKPMGAFPPIYGKPGGKELPELCYRFYQIQQLPR